MKKSQATHYLETLMLAFQRIKSINNEGVEKDGLSLKVVNEFDAVMSPYIFGKKSILPALVKILDKDFAPIDFSNMMYVALRLEPLLGQVAGVLDTTFPQEFDVNWVRGFDPE